MDLVDEIAEIVKSSSGAQSGWLDLLSLVGAKHPSKLWARLPPVVAGDDVKTASEWLSRQLHDPEAPLPLSGVYLGLDTLNMEGPDGHNIEVGATNKCDPYALDTEWPWHCEWYGESHLLQSLARMKRVYDQPEWGDLSDVADYGPFPGYSGLVLMEALRQLQVTSPLLAVWGFHDGDLFFLARHDLHGVEPICRML